MTGACSIIDYLRDDGTQSPFPLIRCGNIFVLPGVPGLLQAKWKVRFSQLMSTVCRGYRQHMFPKAWAKCIELSQLNPQAQ